MEFDIRRRLSSVHKNLKITDEAIDNIKQMLHEFTDIDFDTLINNFGPGLKKCALINCGEVHDSVKKYELTIEYLLFEILELAGNCCLDNGKKTVSVFHIWNAIVCDEELLELFKKYICIYCVQYTGVIPSKIHKKKIIIDKKIVKQKLLDAHIDIDYYAIIIMYNMVTYAANKYIISEDILKKLSLLGSDIGETQFRDDTYLLLLLQQKLLDIIIGECKKLDQKITCTTLHNISKSMMNGHFDFLF